MMKKLTPRLFVASALLALSYSSFAQVTASGKGYLFRIKYTVGTLSKYKMTSVSKSEGLNIKMDMMFTSKVLTFKNGVAKLEYVIEKPMLNNQPMGNKQTVIFESDNRGNFVGERTGNYQLGNIAYPKAPVPIGGSWATDVETTSMGMTMKVKATYKLVAFKTINGKRVALLNVVFKNTGDISSTGKGVTMVSAADGSPLSSNITMKITVNKQVISTAVKMLKL